MNIIRGNLVGTNQRPENVLVRATELTEEQKAQARANIGAASVDDIGTGGGGGNVTVANAVLYTEQDLTEEQQAQARVNIGAIDAAYVDEEIAAFDFIKVVDALPETGLPNRFYLVPKTEPDTQDLFDEYVWVNDAWEYTATKRLEVDLTDYVKKTNYATASSAGVVIISSGLQMVSGGKLCVAPASNNYIDSKNTDSRVITPKNLDYAVKQAICDSELTLTDEEKAAAHAWLGLGSLDSALDSIIAIQNNLIGGDDA